MTSEWQPIETAPKDGTPVLVYATRDGWVAKPARLVASYKSGFWQIYGAAGGEPKSSNIRDPQWLDVVTPTHWMPLPNPPETEVNDER